MNTSMKEMSANKKEKVILSLIYLLFGVMFVVAGMSFYGSAYYGTSIFAELVNPASWIFGILFGGILAVGSWFCKPAGQNK